MKFRSQKRKEKAVTNIAKVLSLVQGARFFILMFKMEQ